MKGFLPAFRAELFDLLTRPMLPVGLLAAAGITWAFGRHAPFDGNGYLVFGAALGAGAKTAGFFLLGIAAVSVAGERTQGTVRWLLPRPVTRSGFVLGKACALAAAALLFLAVVTLAAFGTAAGKPFGDLVLEAETEGFEFVGETEVSPDLAAGAMRGRLYATVLAVLPALLSATGIGLLVSALVAGSAAAVIVAFAVAVPLNFLPEVLGLSKEAARLLPFRAAGDFLAQLEEHGRMLATRHWPEYGAGAALGALGAALGLPLLAALLFSRADLTD